MAKQSRTNEWEFQGGVLGWLNDELKRRPGLGLERVTQEKPSDSTRQRSDLVVWWHRQSMQGFLEIELKTPSTSLRDPEFFRDALEKARRWKTQYFAIWNMQEAELYRTPASGETVTPADRLDHWVADRLIRHVEDWLTDEGEKSLRKRAVQILERAWDLHADERPGGVLLDPSIFVERLTTTVHIIRTEVFVHLSAAAARDAKLRRRLRAMAAEQGFLGIVAEITEAIAGQYAYRIVGQILFYFAFRRTQKSVPELEVTSKDEIPRAFAKFWEEVRRYDYEALFAPSDLDEIVSLSTRAQTVLRDLVVRLRQYDWGALHDDLLGSIFEHLIPESERHLLGQFYTPKAVADLIVALAVDGNRPLVLDPGCGSGTFLMSAYQMLSHQLKLDHEELLSIIWGIDISPFAAELASINLYRLNLNAYKNFPRILARDFFSVLPGTTVPFPPAKSGIQEKVLIPLPKFDAVVGNPPYLRSQNQDDLQPEYKEKLYLSAQKFGYHPASKTDLGLFFIYHSLNFMERGSRLGFVISAAWLSANYGLEFQRLLLREFNSISVISSSAESFFSQVNINTTILVAKRGSGNPTSLDNFVRFVVLKKKLAEIFGTGASRWDEILSFCDGISCADQSIETAEMRIKVVNAAEEIERMNDPMETVSNWPMYLRAPASYFDVFKAES